MKEMSFRTISSHHRSHEPPVFVLIHGIGTSHRYLTRLHNELAAHADVHSIDLPGFGGLPTPAGSPTIPHISRALASVLDELNLRGVVVVGHSMGAQWAAELALQRPDLVTAVVVCGPVTDRQHRSLITQALLLSADFLREPPTLNVVVFGDYLRCGPVWYSKQVRHMLEYPLEEKVALLSRPLLIIRGSADDIAGQRWCEQLEESAALGQISVIPGHRHLVHFTAAIEVAHRILRFLRGVDE